MAKIYLWKPGHNPYNFSGNNTTQLIEFTDEYMMAKINIAGHWQVVGGHAAIENTIPIPYEKFINKCDGKIYIDFECEGDVSGQSWSKLYINNKIVAKASLNRNVYAFDMPSEDFTILFSCGHNNGSGAYLKCYGIYLEIEITSSEKIKSSVKDTIANHPLIQKHLPLLEKE